MGDGTSFEINLGVAGAAGVTAAADSVDVLASRLDQASTAATNAATAVSAGEASYRQAEAAANSAAKALEKIGLAAEAQRGKLAAAVASGDPAAINKSALALASLAAKENEAAGKAHMTKLAMDQEAASLDKLKSASTQASNTQGTLAKSLGAAQAAAQKAAKAQAAAAGSGDPGKLESALGKLGGPLGMVGQKAFGAADAIKKLGESAGEVGPYIAMAVAVVAVTTALVTGLAAITAWGIGLADANRSQQLLSDGIAGSVAGGRQLDATIAALEKRVPQTTDELRNMAADLAKTGLKGDALSKALEDAATKAAEVKWGPDFAKGANTIDKQVARLKKNIGNVFGGLNIESLLTGMGKLVDLFDETSVTGKAMKTLFESIFQPIVDGVAAFLPKVRTAFIQFEILVIKAGIAIKPFGSKILMVAEALGVLIAVIVGVFAAALVVGIAIAVAFWTAVFAIKDAVMGMIDAVVAAATYIGGGLADAFTFVTTKINEAIDFLKGLSLADIGKALIEGLVSGIVGAGGGVLGAVTGVVGGAIDAAKSALGIASPSRVFAEIGAQTGAGMVAGVESASTPVQSSLESMVAPPAATGAAPEPAAASASVGGATYNIVINAKDGDAKGILDAFTEWLEATGAQAGLAVPNA